jgi:hypothetical protein
MKRNEKGTFGFSIACGYDSSTLSWVSAAVDTRTVAATQRGIKAGDVILAINNTAAVGMQHDDAVRLLHGSTVITVTTTLGGDTHVPEKHLKHGLCPSGGVRGVHLKRSDPGGLFFGFTLRDMVDQRGGCAVDTVEDALIASGTVPWQGMHLLMMDNIDASLMHVAEVR